MKIFAKKRESCRRKIILKYFNDPRYDQYKNNCQGCDVCLNWKKEKAEVHEDKTREKGIKYPLSNTVRETGELYLKKYSVKQMAKIRGLSARTIVGHLADWYSAGKELDFSKFVSSEVENKIMAVVTEVGSLEKLRPIKEKLPEEISYDQIKLVVAKIRREEKRAIPFETGNP